MDEKKDTTAQQIDGIMGRRIDGPWDACPIEEKIERLRQELRGLRWALNDIRQRTQYFDEHAHDAKGEIVVPLRRKYGQGEAASGRDFLA